MNQTERRSRKLGWRFVVLAVVLVVIVSAVIRSCWLDVYYIPSESMEPYLLTGDRVLVSRTDYASATVQRGDVVVFDGRGSFAPLNSGKGPVADAVQTVGVWLGVAGSDTVYVKRVIGVAGDRVRCCSTDGRLEVNGAPQTEPYLFRRDRPSDLSFDVVVPQDKLWLMGDHRSVSADSRSLLGAPGGGMVSVEKVIGRPVRILWPLNRFGPLERSASEHLASAHVKSDHITVPAIMPAPPATPKDAQ
ncbi:signal peptidase I [Paenarthrobacter sp. PH39-S1]|uniref:signal peptidase I n=1 Tax=Paenarthrobacter sp. PH39-S1 TaxID=3046204 RepID=UPI0024B8FEA7|nr:signal peptidase I [Paenarthrobacter sp. PH39-S1]MDJ0357585.1 signal peptidase I [Paenarthrobacter sp. PH39-S1]